MIALVLAAALARPADVGFSAARLDRIDGLVAEAIARGELPGAVVLVGRRDRIVFRRAYGSRAVLPSREPMTVDTVFDVASLTKPVATATSVLILVERGRLALGDPVVKYVPEFAPDGGDREKVTVEQLLTHRAGLAPDDPIDLYTGTPEEIFARKYRQPLESPPGTRFRYSDVGYEVLDDLVRRVSGLPLDEFSEREIFRPLGMKDTHFRPLATSRFLG
ncbi:MAG TPA: serine hydrolase domain-containing protein, partial [Thermoanaerobaculia bacterium]|nr:serine hydrolase domain-containing protein [Thermoanaerobaculia bacterium]